ncbi:uncharacterized protein LOC144443618 [Glandiceps talaboti]
MLADLQQLINFSDPFHLVVWCAIILAFFSFLRKSNLVPPSRGSFDPARHLRRCDIDIQDEFLLVAARWSKTLQCHERVFLIPISAIPGSSICPVAAFKRMYSRIPALGRSPVFVYPSKGQVVPLTQSALSSAFGKLISTSGKNPKLYSLHSLRRGGASLAYAAGVPTELIKMHGDWRSDAYTNYVKVPLSARLAVTRCMAQFA